MAAQPAHDGCPHCGARLIKRSEKCLACGAPVSGRSADIFKSSSSGGGGGMNLTTVLIVGIVVLGAGFMLTVGTCGGAAIDTAQNLQSGEMKSTHTTCVSRDDDAKIRDLMQSGFIEIDGKDTLRCFRK